MRKVLMTPGAKFLMCLTIAFAAVFAAHDSFAQALPSSVQPGDGQTTIYVDVAVERQEITAGPYARYAQKYLGVTAPLADKVLHRVTAVKLLEMSGDEAVEDAAASSNGAFSDGVFSGAFSHMSPASGFPSLTVDRISSAAVSLEESARLAAERIFELRRSRLDLITGEVGENVFGGGLSSALAEIARLEEEYLSLFLGLQRVRTDTRQYRITPAKGRLTYTVCRFSEAEGLLPEDNLSGELMVLELKPSVETAAVVTQERPNSRAIPQLVPADMRCRVIFNGVELASEQFLVRQLGEVVYVMP
ncbi:MAG: DUF4831 family protein [Alistipes sp.]|jgi:hypothetical protein|nr:DUF4831 family protein [Alistipes sp.]